MSVQANNGWLAGAAAQFRHECRQYAYAPLTYIFIAAFTLVLAVCIFLVADFFASDDASPRLLTVFLPWVSLVLVPALAMRAWNDDLNDRAVELTFSLPIPLSAVVTGKFVAGVAVLTVALALTFSFPASIAYLGEPDTGVLVATYVAAFAFLVTSFAICLFAAALVREQLGALILGTLVLLILILLGWDIAARIGDSGLGADIKAAAVNLSPVHWLQRMAKGQIELSAAVYFCAMTFAALAAAAFMLRQRQKGVGQARALVLSLGCLAAIAVLVLSLSLATRGSVLRADLTDDRRFSLPAAADAMIDAMPDGIEIDVFWSASETSVPLAIRLHAERVIDRLRTIEQRSAGRLRVAVKDPRPDSDVELDALGAGVQRVPMTSGDYFFLGLTAKRNGRASRLVYLDPERDRLLDYDLLLLLSELARDKTRKLGILSPLVAPTALEAGRPGLSIIEELKRSYDVAVIPHFEAQLPPDLDVLVVIEASILKPEMLYQIDQFVMAGGGLIVLLDPYLRSHAASNQVHPKPGERINDISDLLQAYGIGYLSDAVVGDSANAASVMNAQQRQISYPYWLRLGQDDMTSDHPVVAGLNEILLAEAAGFQLDQATGALPLVTTSPNTGREPRDRFKASPPEQLAAAFEAGDQSVAMAAVVSGNIGSAFQDAPSTANSTKHMTSARRPTSVFAVGDIDWIFDGFAVRHVPSGGSTLSRPINDNFALLLNMIEYASGDPALVAVRSRGRLHRPFTRVADMFRQSSGIYQAKEAELAGRISKVEQTIARIPTAAGVKDLAGLPEDLRAKVDELQAGLLPLKRELRQIRRAMRDDVLRLGRRLTIANIVAGPILVLLLAMGCLAWRKRWHRR